MLRPPAALKQLHDLAVLIRAHHPLVYLETIEDQRAQALLQQCASELGILYAEWTPHKGIVHHFDTTIDNTEDPSDCLKHIVSARSETLYYMRGLVPLLQDAALREQLKEVHDKLWQHKGALVFSGAGIYDLPDDIKRLVTTVEIEPPTDAEYHEFLAALIRDMRGRGPVEMRMDSVDVGRLIQHLRGLTFTEVKRVMSAAITESGTLERKHIRRVLEAKKEIIKKSGVLEYTPAKQSLQDVAGLERLKEWLRRRRAVFMDPKRASEFGLSPPRGLMLLGVPGCGKSLAAKAVASEYDLPLVRLDPGALYGKFVGETEKNLRQAMKTAEALAPVVLWIDEIEKAFRKDSSGGDGGVSQRVFGTFLSWMQDKPDGVFVIATCNDISDMPPELMRKGRFDEIFFVDLPKEDARREILRVHLEQRKRDPDAFDLDELVLKSEGYSGSEIEQAIVSGLYAAYADSVDLHSDHIAHEIEQTRPLSVTMAEKITALRKWAADRTTPAD